MMGLNDGKWPDDWYIYDDGTMHGPLPADRAFSMAPEATSGKPRLISRKGFSQWYALGDLKQLFTMTSQNIPQPLTTPAVGPKLVMPNKIFPKREEAIQRSFARRLPLDHENQEVFAGKASPKVQSPARPPIKGSIKRHLLSEYFHVKSRLRLGTIRNPWASAFTGGVLTLGLSCPFHYNEMASEIAFHTKSQSDHKLGPGFLVLVPIVQVWMIWHLAKQVQALEQQNSYRSVSIILAMFLSFCPPLALAYLQSEVNRHWLLHARQVWLKKRESFS